MWERDNITANPVTIIHSTMVVGSGTIENSTT